MAYTHLKLKSVKQDKDNDTLLHVEYELVHSRAGSAGVEGTCLELIVHAALHPDRPVKVSLSGCDPEGPNLEAALHKLGDWLARAAEAINNRGNPAGVSLPLVYKASAPATQMNDDGRA